MGFRKVLRFGGGWYGWLALQGKSPQDQAIRGLTEGDIFPACRLVVLRGDADRRYLDLPAGAKSFALTDLRAHFLLVELYSELCSGCLNAVPAYNRLFELIESDPELKGRLKLIGMGAGSSKRAVVKFRRVNQVRFPLFADDKREVFNCLGEPVLPVAYLLKNQGNGRWQILQIISNPAESPQAFLGLIKARLKQTGEL